MIQLRPISWIKGALKDFDDFPLAVRAHIARALTIAAQGEKSDDTKPFKGVGGGVFEIALRYRSDAYRVIYDVKIGEALWVIHAFQKKSKSGIKTIQTDVDLIRARLKRLKEALK